MLFATSTIIARTPLRPRVSKVPGPGRLRRRTIVSCLVLLAVLDAVEAADTLELRVSVADDDAPAAAEADDDAESVSPLAVEVTVSAGDCEADADEVASDAVGDDDGVDKLS
jgi:hypothetical protein